MESLLRLSFFMSYFWKSKCSLGQLISKDMLDSKAIYVLTPVVNNDNKLALKLIHRDDELKHGWNVQVPNTVISKLRQKLQGFEKQRQEHCHNMDLRNLLLEVKSELEDVKKLIFLVGEKMVEPAEENRDRGQP